MAEDIAALVVQADLPATSGIYCFLNIHTGIRYVGSAVNIRNRKAHHLKRLRHGWHFNRRFQSAFHKYGEKAFRLVVLECCCKNDLVTREQFWINKFGMACLYNMRPDARTMLGYKPTAEAIEKQASKLRGRRQSKEHRRAISDGQKRSAKTLAHCHDMAQNNKGRKLSEDHRAKLRAATLKFYAATK